MVYAHAIQYRILNDSSMFITRKVEKGRETCWEPGINNQSNSTTAISKFCQSTWYTCCCFQRWSSPGALLELEQSSRYLCAILLRVGSRVRYSTPCMFGWVGFHRNGHIETN